eukprot:6256655-Prymnesium_polylepis.1
MASSLSTRLSALAAAARWSGVTGSAEPVVRAPAWRSSCARRRSTTAVALKEHAKWMGSMPSRFVLACASAGWMESRRATMPAALASHAKWIGRRGLLAM